MGYRTVVVLNNDHDWTNNKNLASDIQERMDSKRAGSISDKGIKVVEVTHADKATLMAISFYGQTDKLAYDYDWGDREQRNLRLLKEAAEKIGYRLVKKTEK